MTSLQTEHLLHLVSSMSKTEKRSFRLHVNRDQQADEKLFVQLFDYLDKSKSYNEQELLSRIPGIKKSQLSNLKANLTKQIMVCLRLLHRENHTDIIIREYIDFAQILQNRGMIKASLDTLEKAKKLCLQSHNTVLQYHILAEERKLESNYITGSSPQKAKKLNDDANEMMGHLQEYDKLSNLSLQLYGMYLKHGYVKDKSEHAYIKEFFQSQLPNIQLDQIGPYEKIFLFQSHVWLAHMTLDFVNYFRYSQKWVDIFEDQPLLIKEDPVLYLKGLHNVLNALYLANKEEKFIEYYTRYVKYGDQISPSMSSNLGSNYLLFKYIHLLNNIFLTGKYEQGVHEIKALEQVLKSNEHEWDTNRLIIFYYKVACVYFGNDDYDNTLHYLNKINNQTISDLRLDIQCFARILTLITHFELGNEYLLPYQLKSVFRFLSKMENLQTVQREMLRFIRQLPKMKPHHMTREFKKLRANLVKLEHDPYEMRPFLYLDVISWLDAKIEKRTISEVIRGKIAARR